MEKLNEELKEQISILKDLSKLQDNERYRKQKLQNIERLTTLLEKLAEDLKNLN